MLLSLLLSVQVEAQAVLSPISVSISAGVSIHWTGLLEWTTGLDYWTHPNCYKIPFKCRTKAKRAHSACYFANVGSLAG